MRIYLDCIPCFVRQALDSARLVTDDERIHEKVVREVLRLASDLDMSQSPPAIGQQIHRLIRELVGGDDPYHRIKKRFNNLALKLYPELRKQILAERGNQLQQSIIDELRKSTDVVIDQALVASIDG